MTSAFATTAPICASSCQLGLGVCGRLAICCASRQHGCHRHRRHRYSKAEETGIPQHTRLGDGGIHRQRDEPQRQRSDSEKLHQAAADSSRHPHQHGALGHPAHRYPMSMHGQRHCQGEKDNRDRKLDVGKRGQTRPGYRRALHPFAHAEIKGAEANGAPCERRVPSTPVVRQHGVEAEEAEGRVRHAHQCACRIVLLRMDAPLALARMVAAAKSRIKNERKTVVVTNAAGA